MTKSLTMGQRLAELHGMLTPAEQANLELILGLSAGHQLPDHDPDSATGRRAVSEAMELLCLAGP
ncbi:hypothetical protein LG634_01130 [Streptomyces bambusae]|uniref:hypothetical protein n=1 Tax=Streptomyces bambusae TaxID=1550616 RepID=UPI001CFC681B|nr:hypothetical protein [Streptomyces bambusae]MCB5163456.1 hypothetical protein [Streptomyces bambusae]